MNTELPAASGRANPLSVLVADDTPANQKIIRSLLQRRGHQVAIAGDGRAALDSIFRDRFDVVLMDVQMPVMNGYETTRALREHEQVHGGHVPIIALTTHAAEGDRQACLEAGMDAYVAKPIDAAKLIHLVEEFGQRDVAGSTSTRVGAMETESHTAELYDSCTVVDYEGSLKRLGGDVDLFKEFIRVFDEDTPGLLKSADEAVAARDAAMLERAAHSLRGLASNFGARPTVAVAGQLEAIAAANRWEDAAQAFGQLTRELARLNCALDDFRD